MTRLLLKKQNDIFERRFIMVLLGLIAMIFFFALFGGIVIFIRNAIVAYMDTGTFGTVLMLMQDNIFMKIFGIALIVVIVLLIFGFISDIPVNRDLRRSDKEMDFAERFQCDWIVRKMDDLPPKNLASESDRYLWFSREDTLGNFVLRHKNKTAFCIVWRDDDWKIQPMEFFEKDGKTHYRLVQNYYEIPSGVEDIYEIDTIKERIESEESQVSYQVQAAEIQGSDKNVKITQVQKGDHNVQIGMVINRRDDEK